MLYSCCIRQSTETANAKPGYVIFIYYIYIYIYSTLASISEKDQQGQSSNSGRFPGQVLDTLQQSQEQNIFWVWYDIFASNLQTTNCPFTIYRPSYTKVSSPALDQYPGISWWLPLPSFHNQHSIPQNDGKVMFFHLSRMFITCPLGISFGRNSKNTLHWKNWSVFDASANLYNMLPI